MSLRDAWMRVHLWLGLTLGVLGVSGSLMWVRRRSAASTRFPAQ